LIWFPFARYGTLERGCRFCFYANPESTALDKVESLEDGYRQPEKV
jgi:hypothetical protein